MEEEIHNVPLKMTPLSQKSEGHSCTSELESVRVRKNHVTTRISSVPSGTSSYSAPSSETLYDESSVSTSPATASPTLISINNNLKSDKIDDFNLSKPNYMNLTQSTKAMPQRANMFAFPNMQKCLTESHFYNKSMEICIADDVRSRADSKFSGHLYKDLHPPLQTVRHDSERGRRRQEIQSWKNFCISFFVCKKWIY